MQPHLPPGLLLAALLALPCQLGAQRPAPTAGRTLTEVPGPELWVSGYDSEALHRFRAADGAQLPDLAGVPGAQSVHAGPDGLHYAVAEKVDRVLRYRGTRFLDVFVQDDPATPQDEDGPLDGPTAAVFGPDGNLYVASFDNDRVLRYDGATGAYLGPFVAPGSGNLDGPDAGMCFGPDGHLYVPSFFNHRVLRYDGATGAFLDRFLAPNAGGLRNPRMLLFRPSGELWVSSWGSNAVLAFDASGGFLRTLLTTTRPTGFALGLHDGDLYVTSDQTDRVERFDLFTGTRIEVFAGSGAGIDGGTYLYFFER